MSGFRRFLGLFVLTVTPATLLAGIALPASGLSGVTLGVETILAVSVAITGTIEYARTPYSRNPIHAHDVNRVLACTVGALAAYQLSVAGGLGPVLGSALVGVLAALALPSLAAAAYCGSFVGMLSPAVVGGIGPVAGGGTYPVAASGAIAGLALVAADDVFDGYGGKLGTIALFGCLTATALTGSAFGAGTPVEWASLPLVVPVAGAAAVATSSLSHDLGLGSVLGSAVVGVVAGVAFPVVGAETPVSLAAVAFCASFVGMASRERLSGLRYVAGAGALSGVVFLLATRTLGGAGGKLGTVAFVSCAAFVAATELATRLRSAREPALSESDVDLDGAD